MMQVPAGRLIGVVIWLLWAALSKPAMSAEADLITTLTVPSREEVALPSSPVKIAKDGSFEWLTFRSFRPGDNERLRNSQWVLVHVRWNPLTKNYRELALERTGSVISQVPVSDGIWYRSYTTGEIGFYSQDVVTKIDVGSNFMHLDGQLLTIGNDKAMIIGSTSINPRIISAIVTRVGSKLESQRLPDLALPYRGGFTSVVLDKNRVMLLGGKESKYRGCNLCRSNTYILDLDRKVLTEGPRMIEPRTEHAATLLPDGSVLVTGGWTQQQDWGHGPSRTAELWNPRTNKFEPVAPMPTGNAGHRGMWMPGQEGKVLLMVAGMSNSLPAYDISSGTWFNAAAWPQGSENGACTFLPVTIEGTLYAWQQYKEKYSCSERSRIALSSVRSIVQTSAGDSPVPESMLITYRSSAAFVPAKAGSPALVIGGHTNAGMGGVLNTAAVEAVGTDGSMSPRASLNEPRHDAFAFRIDSGYVVVGGLGDRIDQKRSMTLPMEWIGSLPRSLDSRWKLVDDSAVLPTSAIGQLSDSSLLEVDELGDVTQLHIRLRAGSPRLERSPWPALNRARRSTDSDRVRIRELADGSVVVAGGEVQAEKIVLLKSDSNMSDAVDEYVGIGPYLPSRRHEIFDPTARLWRTSAPATAAGGRVHILADGQVVKVARMPARDGAADRYVTEVSNPEGSTWTGWQLISQSKLRWDDRLKLFEIGGELFASGIPGEVDTADGPIGLERFNPDTALWEMLWQGGAKDKWGAHVGRLITRRLTNGKVVVLPVGGI